MSAAGEAIDAALRDCGDDVELLGEVVAEHPAFRAWAMEYQAKVRQQAAKDCHARIAHAIEGEIFHAEMNEHYLDVDGQGVDGLVPAVTVAYIRAALRATGRY